MSWLVVTGCNMQCLQLRWVETVLPSSVMMGMLDPVVTDAWRTKPCTGLLSGDDLSIPGGVKPLHIRKQRHRLNTSADKTVLWIKYSGWSANLIADVKVLNLNIYLIQIESCKKKVFSSKPPSLLPQCHNIPNSGHPSITPSLDQAKLKKTA